MTKTKKILAVLMCVVMVFTALPMSAFADEVASDETSISETVTEDSDLLSGDVEDNSTEPIDENTAESEETAEETAEPTETAEPDVSAEPTAKPTETPVEPTAEPTTTPSATPSVTPSASPTAEPTATPVPYVDGYTLDRDKIGGAYTYPVSANYNYVSQGFQSGVHSGIDIPTDEGASAVAVADGTVTAVQYWDGKTTDGMQSYGNMVEITLNDGVIARYAHLASIAVGEGQAVKVTDVIGTVGSTGNSTGTHLHFEIIVGGVQKNPKNYVTGEYELDEELETLDGTFAVVTDNGVETVENPIIESEANEELIELADNLNEYAPSLASVTPEGTTGTVYAIGRPNGSVDISPVSMDGSSSKGISLHWITLDGTTYPAYCLDASLSLGMGRPATQTDISDETKLAELFVVANGYNETGFTDNSSAEDKAKFYATQIMVWLAEYGYIYKDGNGYTMKNEVADFISACGSDPNSRISSDYGNTAVLADYLKQIASNIKVSSVSPSFVFHTKETAKNNKVILKYSDGTYTLTLTDKNKVFTYCSLGNKDGLTAKKDGNNLVISVSSYFDGTKYVAINVPQYSGGKYFEFTDWDLQNGYQHWGVGGVESTRTVYVAVECEAVLGNLEVQKSSEDDVVTNFDFTLTGGGKTYSKTTGKDGKAVFSNIPVYDENGKKITYTLTEVLRSWQVKRYEKKSSVSVTLTANSTVTKKFTNTVLKGTVKIKKKYITLGDYKNSKTFLLVGTYLSNENKQVGKTVKYYEKDTGKLVSGVGITAKNDSDGYAIFENVPYGTYTLIEIDSTPHENDIYYPLKVYDVELNSKETTQIIEQNNTTNKEKEVIFSLTKTDAENKKGTSGNGTLEGAIYILTEVNNGKENSIAYITLTADGKATFPKVDCTTDNVNSVYVIKEFSAPEGYEVDPNTYYITVDGSVCTDLNGKNADKVFTWTTDKIEWSNVGEGVEKAVTPTLEIKVKDTIKKGTFTIEKFTDTDGDEVYSVPEKASFEYWLTSAGSYENAKETEKGTLTTENGKATSKELPYGVYTVHQTTSEDGKNFAEDFTVLVTGDKSDSASTLSGYDFAVYTDKTVAVTEKADISVNGNNIKIINKSKDYKLYLYKTNEQGKKLTETEMTVAVYRDVDGDGKYTSGTDTYFGNMSYVGDGEYQINVPFGTENSGKWLVKETYPVLGHGINTDYIPVTIDKNANDGDKILVTSLDNSDYFIDKPIYINTMAHSGDDKELDPTDKETFTDTVDYENLPADFDGYTFMYRMVGTVMLKSTAKDGTTSVSPLTDENGNEITSEKIFTVADSTKSTGTIDIDFTVDCSKLKGKELVVFEKLYFTAYKDGEKIADEKELASHEDKDDWGQTLKVVKPELHTKASDEYTKDNVVYYGETTIKDTVTYENLIVGHEYTIKGKLLDKATGEVLTFDGNAVESEPVTFIAESENGTVDVLFTFDSTSTEKSATYVASETLYHENFEVAVHADINDSEQTVYKPSIGTTLMHEGGHTALAEDNIKLTDTVRLDNLVVGQTYVIEGYLVRKSDNADVTEKVYKSVTATSSTMSVDVDFTVNAKDFEGDSVVAFEFLYHNDWLVAHHMDKNDENQTVDFPKIHTTATDVNTGDKTTALGTTTINDEVKFNNLRVGEVYTVTGTIVNAETGETIKDENGNEISKSITFTASSKNGKISVPIEINTSYLAGQTLVVFEDLYRSDVKIAVHHDVKDTDQTVYVPKIHTTATVNGSHKLDKIPDTVKLVDTVTYENLVVGKEYTVTGTLMDKDTGERFGDYTASTSFVAENTSGSVDVVFEFSGSALGRNGKTLVVFESLSENGVEVATHADINDSEQSVEFPKNYNTPKTGDNFNNIWLYLFLGSLTGAVGSLIFAYFRYYRKRNKN